jgi:hypothetical protein
MRLVHQVAIAIRLSMTAALVEKADIRMSLISVTKLWNWVGVIYHQSTTLLTGQGGLTRRSNSIGKLVSNLLPQLQPLDHGTDRDLLTDFTC